MLIKVKIPRNSGIRQLIKSTYTELYNKFKKANPEDKKYTRAKLSNNIRMATSINMKTVQDTDIVNSTFDDWAEAGYMQIYHFHWYFAVSLAKGKNGQIIAIIQDAHYEGDHYNGPRLPDPYDDVNESKRRRIIITESALRKIVRETIANVLYS